MATYEETTHNILSDQFVIDCLKRSNLSEEEKYNFIYHIVGSFSSIKRHPEFLFTSNSLPSEYVSFDIETTGLSKNDRITQIAAVKIKNGRKIDSFNSYVNIGDFELPTQIAYLTGITPDMLKNAPKLSIVMENFATFINGYSLIGHNATTFDLPKLANAGYDLRKDFAIDTVSFAQASPLDIDNCKLDTLKLYYGIETTSHNAFEDADATAQIYEYLKNKDYVRRSSDTPHSNIFESLRFCYTGSFRNYSRQSLENKILISGGKITKTVTKLTDYLIVGTQISKQLVDGVHSSKELKCMELMNNGHKIKMISEEEFENLLNG